MYTFFSSYSVIAGGSEQTKKAFNECFDNLMEKHFKGNGIPFDHISFQIYLYWCTKTTSNSELSQDVTHCGFAVAFVQGSFNYMGKS